mmetsp:Transcript_7723/g.47892  ORF Transcript_7723/g.47892 Transcript_7723/m.47892 type:complete len:329 (-) Transcript_7723:1964-2950(-)
MVAASRDAVHGTSRRRIRLLAAPSRNRRRCTHRRRRTASASGRRRRTRHRRTWKKGRRGRDGWRRRRRLRNHGHAFGAPRRRGRRHGRRHACRRARHRPSHGERGMRRAPGRFREAGAARDAFGRRKERSKCAAAPTPTARQLASSASRRRRRRLRSLPFAPIRQRFGRRSVGRIHGWNESERSSWFGPHASSYRRRNRKSRSKRCRPGQNRHQSVVGSARPSAGRRRRPFGVGFRRRRTIRMDRDKGRRWMRRSMGIGRAHGQRLSDGKCSPTQSHRHPRRHAHPNLQTKRSASQTAPRKGSTGGRPGRVPGRERTVAHVGGRGHDG